MKASTIRLLDTHQIKALSAELFEYIGMVYNIKEPDEKFYSYFITYLKKYYSFMTFEQLESAFELNSLDHLNNFLQKIGQRPDNKVSSFSIPNLTKIINAYNSYKGIEKSSTNEIYNPLTDKNEPGGAKDFKQEDKHKINNEYCDYICLVFEKYRDEFEETLIKTSLNTCKILSNCGVIDANKIDFTEKININYKDKTISENQNLIYKSFDVIIQDQKHIEDYLKNQRVKYSQEMPY